MATLILSTAGQIIGSTLGGTLGGSVGSLLGTALGSAIDNRFIFGQLPAPAESLAISVAKYGDMIPIIYGHMRVEGKIIWAAPIKKVNTSNAMISKGIASTAPLSSNATYEYYATFAMCICEGIINDIHTIWADSSLISKSSLQYRLYLGSEEQNPDPLIMSFEKVAPAYRGTAYIVIENFPITPFGNRIPKFSFEVEHSAYHKSVCSKINAVNLIPASGEFVYDAEIQSKVPAEYILDAWHEAGYRSYINNNTDHNISNALVAINQIQGSLPNLQWINLTISWFADGLDIASCKIYPATEYRDGGFSSPDDWAVAGLARTDAREVLKDSQGNMRFGGTPSDGSLVRIATELKARGYKVMVYPLLMVDAENKPWRGRITGEAQDVDKFFEEQYDKYILHYAQLLGTIADGIIIGSEMVGLTSIMDSASLYPAISRFAYLADEVRSIIGAGKIITYAADWSEYHSSQGNFNMDLLWSSQNIDVIGIDAYFPLTDKPQPNIGFTKQEIIDGWTSGEGWDYYYDNGNKVYFSDAKYAWKNIEHWWTTQHINADSSTTPWQPQSKPIWFTEFGFPSVDCATNQPNVFYDPTSSESKLPRYSRGTIDVNLQSMAIEATLEKWQGSSMITNMFLWAWDARPYPDFPIKQDIWSDSAAWGYGHWINGKINKSSLAFMIEDIACRALPPEAIDTTGIYGYVDGHIISYRQTILEAIEIAQTCYMLHAYEAGDKIIFGQKRDSTQILSVPLQDILPSRSPASSNTTIIAADCSTQGCPKELTVHYINRINGYNPDSVSAIKSTATDHKKIVLMLPALLSKTQAESHANVLLHSLWGQKTNFKFKLPLKYLNLEPFDLIRVENLPNMRVQSITMDSLLTISAISEDPSAYHQFTNKSTMNYELSHSAYTAPPRPQVTDIEIYELPPILTMPMLTILPVVLYKEWPGTAIYMSQDEGETFEYITTITTIATWGETLEQMTPASPCIIDKINRITIYMRSGTLESIADLSLCNGRNMAIIGNEIVQFQNAELIGENKYIISNFIRGKFGSVHAINLHEARERFILLDRRDPFMQYAKQNIGMTQHFKSTTIGMSLSSGQIKTHTINGTFFRPFAPVNVRIETNPHGITISWIRCTRINGEWKDYVDVSLNEETELYELEFYDDSENLVRTALEVTTTSYEYSLEDFLEDYGSNAAQITVVIYQISNTIGRGHPCSHNAFIDIKASSPTHA